MTPLRGVFSRDDAWLSTGDLFRRDADGDYWRLDGVYDVIHTADGPVLAAPIRDALGDLPAVDLASPTGCGRRWPPTSWRSPRVTLRPGQELTAEALSQALGEVAEGHRPADRARDRRDPGHHVVSADDPAPAPSRVARAHRGAGLVSGPWRQALPAAHRCRAQAAVRQVATRRSTA